MGGSDAAQAQVNLAYEVLSDPIQRQAHDIYWKNSTNRSTDQGSTRDKQQSDSSAQRWPSQQSSGSGEALAAFRRKLEQTIQSKKAAIWLDIKERTEKILAQLHEQIASARSAFFYFLGGGLIAGLIAVRAPILWLAAGWLGFLAFSKFKGVELQGKKFAPFNVKPERLRKHAEELAARQCQKEAAGFDQYMTDFASIIETAMRASTYDDSETHVARRIAVALFLMGYAPLYFDNDSRSITFADGDETMVVRFRHRAGAASNVKYVEGLYGMMQFQGAKHGILFCSPGLSGNAARYAQARGIKWYTLEGMNKWIDAILIADYSGPSGDVLDNLKKLKAFLARITPTVAYSPRRHGRRRWR